MRKKLKLKGQITKNFDKKQKERMQRTLDNMQQVRMIDSNNLREIIRQKLVWAMNEKQKGLKLIEQTKQQVYRLEGIIIFIQDLLSPQEEKNDNS